MPQWEKVWSVPNLMLPVLYLAEVLLHQLIQRQCISVHDPRCQTATISSTSSLPRDCKWDSHTGQCKRQACPGKDGPPALFLQGIFLQAP